MKIQKSKRPLLEAGSRFGRGTLLLSVPAGLGLVAFGLFLYYVSGEVGLSLGCVVPGVLLGLAPILLNRFWLIPQGDRFQQSSAIARAEVIDRSMKRTKVTGGGSGDLIDLVVLPLLWLVDRFAPSYEYALIVQFDASKPGSDSRQIALEMPVSKKIYDDHPPGSNVNLTYSVDDPRMAIL